jgi:hypothetical protein
MYFHKEYLFRFEISFGNDWYKKFTVTIYKWPFIFMESSTTPEFVIEEVTKLSSLSFDYGKIFHPNIKKTTISCFGQVCCF